MWHGGQMLSSSGAWSLSVVVWLPWYFIFMFVFVSFCIFRPTWMPRLCISVDSLFQWSTCVHTCSEPPQLSDGGGRDQVSTEFQVFLRYSVSSPPPSVRPRTLVQPFTSKRVAKVQFWHVPLILSCLPLLWASCSFPVQHGGPGPAWCPNKVLVDQFE